MKIGPIAKFNKILCSLFIISLFVINFNLPKAAATGATLSISPATKRVNVGATITATLNVSPGSLPINAAEATITYSSSCLEFQSVSTTGSIFTFWTAQPTGGTASTTFGGGLADPGYSGTLGKILTLTFKAKRAGTATLTISGARVLANDGVGTDIYSSATGATYTVSGTATTTRRTTTTTTTLPTLKSTTHPNQDAWYNKRTVTLSWSGGTGATGYGYSFNQTPEADPSTSTYGNITSKTYEKVADGTWYFHLKAKTSSGYLTTVHYQIQIDTVAPEEFTVNVHQESGLINPRPSVTFETTDALSDIDKYEAKIDNGDAFTINSGDLLPVQHPGHHSITIKAYDKAGNIRESTATYRVQGIYPPTVIAMEKLVGILDPVCFEGYAEEGDRVYAYLDDKESSNFLVKDALLSNSGLANKLSPPSGSQVAWSFCYNKMLLPGDHTFRFNRIDQSGAESELTSAIKIKVEAGTVKLAGRTIPMMWIIFATSGLLFLAIILILFLLRKIRILINRGRDKFVSIASWLKNSARFSARIENDIDKVIPDRDISKEEAEEIKDKLKQDVVEEEKRFDNIVEEENTD